MNLDHETYELIDRYILNECTADEKLHFEQQLKINEQLREEYESQLELIKALDEHDEKIRIGNELQSIHRDMTRKDRRAPKSVRVSKRKRFLSTIAIAASVSIITFISTLQIINRKVYKANIKDNTAIEELNGRLDQISNQQKSLRGKLDIFEQAVPSESQTAFGSCIQLTTDGYYLTSAHLVKKADSVLISKPELEDTSYHAKVVFRSNQHDLALLYRSNKIIKPSPVFISQKEPKMGDYLFTLGYPKRGIVFGEGSLSSYTGHLDDTSSYQVSIPANPGNSGGPIVNSQGEIVGLVTGRHPNNNAATYAIKSLYIKDFIDDYNESKDSSSIEVKLSKRNAIYKLSKPKKIEYLQKTIFRIEVTPQKRN